MPETVDIIIVDSDSSRSQQLSRILAELRFSVSAVPTVAAAIETIRDAGPSVIFLDQDSVPAKDLARTIRIIAEIDTRAVVLLVALRPDKQTVIEALKSGASDVLHRPINRDIVIAVLSRFAGQLTRRHKEKFSVDLFKRAKLELTVHSSTAAVAAATASIAKFLSSALGTQKLLRIELALQELMRNALEHGNLGIPFEEKRALCEREEFEAFVEAKSLEAQKAGKTIEVSAELCEQGFACRIKDQGKGFDWKRCLPESEPNSEQKYEISGRGLLLVAQIFDSVEFNQSGNEVTVRKKLELSQ